MAELDLTKAIEAGERAVYRHTFTFDLQGALDSTWISSVCIVSIEGAAPEIAQAALEAAADRAHNWISGPEPTSQWGQGYREGVLAVEAELRERAARVRAGHG